MIIKIQWKNSYFYCPGGCWAIKFTIRTLLYHRRFNHFTIKLTDFAIKLTDCQCFGVNANFNCII